MTWKEVLVDLGIYGSICAALFTVMFIYNFIRAPKIMKKLEEERKRKAGLASLNQVLAEEHKRISEEIDEVLDADEEAHEREAQERNE
jgi:biopolymer transport protein ExbB/TolQ